MAAHDWELVRDLGLAQARGDADAVARIQAAIESGQRSCDHVPNPERPERCYKCGFGLRPAVRKCDVKQIYPAKRECG